MRAKQLSITSQSRPDSVENHFHLRGGGEPGLQPRHRRPLSPPNQALHPNGTPRHKRPSGPRGPARGWGGAEGRNGERIPPQLTCHPGRASTHLCGRRSRARSAPGSRPLPLRTGTPLSAAPDRQSAGPRLPPLAPLAVT